VEISITGKLTGNFCDFQHLLAADPHKTRGSEGFGLSVRGGTGNYQGIPGPAQVLDWRAKDHTLNDWLNSELLLQSLGISGCT
jgi:hypothetical protein